MFSLLAHLVRRLRSPFRSNSARGRVGQRRRNRYRNKVWTAAEVLEDRSLLSATLVSTNFNSGVPSNIGLVGTASFHSASTDVYLTTAGSGQLGSLLVNSHGSRAVSIDARAYVYIGGDASGGDGLSFGYGDLSGSAFAEGGENSRAGVWISIDTFQGNTNNGEIAVYYRATPGGTTQKLASHVFTGTSRPNLAPDGRRWIEFYVSTDGNLTYYHPSIGTRSVGLSGWNPQSNWRFGLGARTGAAVDIHVIDELYITDTTPNYAPVVDTGLSQTFLNDAMTSTVDYGWSASDFNGNLDRIDATVRRADNSVVRSSSYTAGTTGMPKDGSSTGNSLSISRADGLGTYTFSVTATDNTGLVTNGPSRTVAITDDDTRPPTITLNGPSGTVLDTENQVWSWSVLDEALGGSVASGSTSTVRITRNGTEIFSRSYGANVGGDSFDFNSYGVGTYEIRIESTDGDSDRAGDSLTSVVTRTANVLFVNDAPSGANAAVTTSEDVPYVFQTADFNFSDPSDSPPNAWQAVKITDLPTAGALTLNGSAVTAGTTIAVADIAAGRLRFVPGLNGSGNGYASFTFQVQDDGGTENGGVDLDQTPNTIVVHVTPVADVPTVQLNDVAGNEDAPIAFSLAGAANVTDTDGSESITSLVIGNIPVGAKITDGIAAHTFIASAGLTWKDVVGWNLSSLTITPPPSSGDDFILTVTATATESGNGSQATNFSTFKATVNAVADVPTVVVADTTANEDALSHPLGFIPLTFSASLNDSDPAGAYQSETLQVVVSGIPSGALLSDGSGGHSFPAGVGENGDSVDITGWNFAELRIVPTAHSGDNFTLTFTVTATDSEQPGEGGGTGETAADNVSTVVRTIQVTVNAVGDDPNLSVLPASGREDTLISLTVNTSLVDRTDGSESLTLVVSNIPEGAVLSDGAGGHSFASGVNDNPTWVDITSWTLSDLKILPPLNDNADFDLTFTATATDRELNGEESETEVPGDDVAVTTRTLRVEVLPVNDAPIVDCAGPEQLDQYASAIQLFDVDDRAQRLLVIGQNAPPSFTIDQAQALAFDLRALVSDVETDPSDFTFTVSVDPRQGDVYMAGSHIAIFIPNPDFVGTATFAFTATDTGDGLIGGAGLLSDREKITGSGTVSIVVTRFQDMGDAPESYHTLADTNGDGRDGARHGGSHVGLTVLTREVPLIYYRDEIRIDEHGNEYTVRVQYSTTQIQQFPVYEIVRLGRSVGFGDANGQPGALADGDDTFTVLGGEFGITVGEVNGTFVDDEDGVFLVMGLGTRTDVDKETSEGIVVKSRIGVVAPMGGFLDGWIDFNGDGVFQDSDVAGEYSEHLFDGQSQLLTATQDAKYINYFDIFVPPNSCTDGPTYARFRVSSRGNLAPTGFAADGEVEDYQVTIADMTPGPGNTTPESFSTSMDVASQEFIEHFADELIADPDFEPPAKDDPNYVPFAFHATGGAGGQEADEGEEGFERLDELDEKGETLQQIIDRINEELQASRPAGESWLVFVVHPIDFVVTDAVGRTFGSVGGAVTQNDFGNKVTYSGDGAVEVLVIRGATHGEYTMEFVGVGGVFRGGSSLLTGYGEQVVTFQGALGAGSTIDLALDYAPPPVFLQLNQQADANGQSSGQVFLNVADNVEGDADLDALAKLAGLDSENLTSQDTLRGEWDGMVKVVRTNATAAKRLVLDELTPDWLATWPEAFDELTANSESAELVEQFWKGLGQSLMGGIPGQVFHLAEVMGVEIPHLFLPNDAPPSEPLPAKSGDAGAAAGDVSDEKTAQSAAARQSVSGADVLEIAGPLAVALNEGKNGGSTAVGQIGTNLTADRNRARVFPAPVALDRRSPAAPLESNRSNAP